MHCRVSFSALIFDLDGTLLDSNNLHVRAWWSAFQRFKLDVPERRIIAEIGKGGDQLVPSLVGDAKETKYGERLRKAHDKEYRKLVESEGLRLFPSWVRTGGHSVETLKTAGAFTVYKDCADLLRDLSRITPQPFLAVRKATRFARAATST